MKNLALELKKIADDMNTSKSSAELDTIISIVRQQAEQGKYSYSGSGELMKETIQFIKDLGFKIEFGGRMNETDYEISWKDLSSPVEVVKEPEPPKQKLFYADGVIGKGLMSREAYVDYVNGLIERFDNVSWGGVGSKHWSTDFSDVVVVYEKGIRGPADWFYLNKDHKWAHGGYSGYKTTYTNAEFLEMIVKILEHNKKYG